MLSTNYVPGAPVWVDLGSPDVSASADFYGALFGWQVQDLGPEAGGYGLFALGGKVVGAVGPLGEPGASPAWTLYFHTPDADATADAVRSAGGTVRAEPFDVFEQGRIAQFTDPTGAQFAVWQPAARKGLDAVTDPNTLCWTELHTPDPGGAKRFYDRVFGWQAEDMPMNGFTYTVVTPAGSGQDATQGGIMGISDEMRAAGMGPRWQPYFEVADVGAVVARATERGASVPMGPDDVPAVGRIAQIVDPSGAPFAVITSATTP